MVWNGDDIKLKEQHKVGHPDKTPFKTIEEERDFVRRARIMLDRYYVDDPKSKSNMRFGPGNHISKSRFWALLLVYYHHERGADENFHGYADVLKDNFDRKQACDHKSIRNSYLMLESLNVHHKYTTCSDQSRQNAQDENRRMYHDIIEIWESLI